MDHTFRDRHAAHKAPQVYQATRLQTDPSNDHREAPLGGRRAGRSTVVRFNEGPNIVKVVRQLDVRLGALQEVGEPVR